MKPRITLMCLAGCLLAVLTPSRAAAQAVAETVEAIQHARITTRILFVTAHPDDEWPSLLAYLSHDRGADVGLLTITRGQGGQNAIGPEQGDEMGMVRTNELLSADKIYGVRQFFTRAPDFGYSKSADETLKIWGEVPVEDMVRVIRMFRPDILINGWGGIRGGHGQHQASGILTPQAVAKAADPKAFPLQIAEGLRPWQTPLVLQFARDNTQGALRIPAAEISPIWGKSYIEMGIEGRSQHRSQGTPASSLASFFRRPIYVEATGGRKLDLKLLSVPLSTLADDAGSIRGEVVDADLSLASAREAALRLDWPAAAKALATAGRDIAAAQKKLAAASDSAKENVLWELARTREKIDAALSGVMAAHLVVRADRHELVAGESLSVQAVSVDGPRMGSIRIATPGLEVPGGWAIAKQETDAQGTHFTVSIPAGANPPHSPAEAVLPWPAPLVQAVFQASMDGYEFTVKQPAVAEQATTTEVVTYPLELVPAVSLTVDPRQVMLPANNSPRQIELLARVRHRGASSAEVSVGLDVPSGWHAEPVAPLHFAGAGDQLVRFVVTPPGHSETGSYPLKPYARIGSQTFRESVEPLPSLPTRSWSEPADATVHVLDLVVPGGIRVGYIAAENDPLPDLLRQIGIRVDLLDEVQLAFGDLSRYDAIAAGIRVYELRPDVARANSRLLDYVRQGGTLVVQYEHSDVWNRLHPAPFRAEMPDQTARITDENSPVRFVVPDSSLLNFPNKITMADFEGWVQERGLYFWGTFDQRYQGVLAMRDPGEEELLGGLVTARDGKGVYIYTGLAFFRQLPAGVPGAYRLFVNLLSQSKAK